MSEIRQEFPSTTGRPFLLDPGMGRGKVGLRSSTAEEVVEERFSGCVRGSARCMRGTHV